MAAAFLKRFPPPVLWVHPLYFLIVLVPLAIFWMHGFISDHMMARDLDVSPAILKQGYPWLEAAGRYRFIAATWFYAALTFLAVAILVRRLFWPMAAMTRLAAFGTLGFVISLVLIPALTSTPRVNKSYVFDRLGSDVFREVLSQGKIKGCNAPDDPWVIGLCGEAPVLTMFDAVMGAVNILAGLGVGALIVGMILCLGETDSDDIEEQASVLADNLRQMRQQLYLSGLILTFGMLFATSWMYWPLQMVLDSERSAYSAVLLSAALYTGTYFSLLILSFYLPVALILDGRVRRLSWHATNRSEREGGLDFDAWKQSHGLKEGASEYLRAGLALTAPILAAFAGGISPIAV